MENQQRLYHNLQNGGIHLQKPHNHVPGAARALAPMTYVTSQTNRATLTPSFGSGDKDVVVRAWEWRAWPLMT